MATCSALFTLVGLAALVLGDANARVTGLMLVLLFGFGAAGYLGGPLLTRRGPGTIELGRAGSEGAFVFGPPRAKRAATLIGAVGLAGGTALLYVIAGGWVLATCAVFVGLYLLLALYRTFRPLRLVITPTRVLVGGSEIAWENIDDVDLYAMPAGNTTVDMVGIVLPADSFAGPGEEVVDAIELYRHDAGRRRSIGGERELTQLRETLGEGAARA